MISKKDILIEKLLSPCRQPQLTVAGLESCCEAIIHNYDFNCVYLAYAHTPEQPLWGLAHSGSEELMQNCMHRLGVEDRVALSKLPSKIFTDITGKPKFSASGALRMQKPNGGVFFTFNQEGKDYLLLGCVHQEPRPYEAGLVEELGSVWNQWRQTLRDALHQTNLTEPPATAKKHTDTKTTKEGAEQPSLPLTPHLSHRSTHLVDEVTHLFNKDYFEEQLSVEVERAKRYSRSVSLILLMVGNPDVAGGRTAGDQVAVQVAEVLDECVRKEDIICRIEDRKFAVLLPDTAKDTYGTIAKRIFKHLKEVVGEKSHVFINLSAASFPDHAAEAQALRDRAESLLKQAQEAGPNKAVLSE